MNDYRAKLIEIEIKIITHFKVVECLAKLINIIEV